MLIQTDYLRHVFDKEEFVRTLNNAENDIMEWGDDFDSIAFTGVSGAALAFPLSVSLDKSLLCVRKRGESNHSPFVVEGYIDTMSYIIVDDFVHSGATIRRIIREIKLVAPAAIAKGIYLYKDQYNLDLISIPVIPYV